MTLKFVFVECLILYNFLNLRLGGGLSFFIVAQFTVVNSMLQPGLKSKRELAIIPVMYGVVGGLLYGVCDNMIQR